MSEKVKICFVGVDEWNRPTFCEVLNKSRYYCDICKLFDFNTTEEEIMDWYSLVGVSGIVFKGSCFYSEPYGELVNVELVTRDETADIFS